MTLEEKKKKLAELNKKFEKSYGEKGQVKTANNLDKVKFYSTGIMGIDLALNGGIGIGRVLGCSGTFSSAKSTLAYMTIAEQQRKDPSFYAYIYDNQSVLFSASRRSSGNQIKRQHRQGVQQRTREGVVRAAFDDIVKRSRERAQACIWQQDQRLLNHVPHLGKIHQTQRR